MKNQIKLAALALLLSTFNHQLSTLHAQGSLTPPGPPAPTMKTLDQIEARTPISSLPYTIANGGSYYLTGNLTAGGSNGIVVAASGVTLDLNGFTIYSSSYLAQYGGTAILLSDGITHLTIENGHIFSGVVHGGLGYSGSGFGSGIYGGADDIIVKNISVSGCLYNGIVVGTSSPNASPVTLVDSCLVQTVGGYGIGAITVKNSLAVDCGGTAIGALQAFDSRGESTYAGHGISALFTAQNCYGIAHGAQNFGIWTGNALNCHAESYDDSGLSADTAENCFGISHSSGYYGIECLNTAQNCAGYTTGNGYGIWAGIAENCYGESDGNGFGVYASYNAVSCYGFSFGVGGVGLHAYNASYCVGRNYSGGVGIQTTMATGCINYSGTTSTTYKYNMP